MCINISRRTINLRNKGNQPISLFSLQITVKSSKIIPTLQGAIIK